MNNKTIPHSIQKQIARSQTIALYHTLMSECLNRLVVRTTYRGGLVYKATPRELTFIDIVGCKITQKCYLDSVKINQGGKNKKKVDLDPKTLKFA